MLAALLIFAATYLVVSGVQLPYLHLDRTSGALLGAVAMVLFGQLPVAEAYRAIHMDTLGLLLGMMIISAYLIEARFFRFLAWETISRSGSPRRLLVALVFVAGTLSAMFVNDTVCVMFTPLVVTVIEEAALPALPFLLALGTATNIGGVATYTGNPQNMIVGTHAGISFGRYFLHLLPVAALGLAADALLLLFLFRRELPAGRLAPPRSPRPELDRVLLAKTMLVLAFTLTGFLLGFSMSGTALAAGGILVLIARRPPKEAIGRIDFPLLLFFAALFVVVRGVSQTGSLERANAWLLPFLGGDAVRQLAGFSLVTVVGSNVFSNVPWVLLGVESVPRLLDPERGWMVLAMASTLAGNLTIFGSVANLIVLELAGEHGRVGFFRFFRYGVVITAATVALGLGVLTLETLLLP